MIQRITILLALFLAIAMVQSVRSAAIIQEEVHRLNGELAELTDLVEQVTNEISQVNQSTRPDYTSALAPSSGNKQLQLSTPFTAIATYRRQSKSFSLSSALQRYQFPLSAEHTILTLVE